MKKVLSLFRSKRDSLPISPSAGSAAIKPWAQSSAEADTDAVHNNFAARDEELIFPVRQLSNSIIDRHHQGTNDGGKKNTIPTIVQAIQEPHSVHLSIKAPPTSELHETSPVSKGYDLDNDRNTCASSVDDYEVALLFLYELVRIADPDDLVDNSLKRELSQSLESAMLLSTNQRRGLRRYLQRLLEPLDRWQRIDVASLLITVAGGDNDEDQKPGALTKLYQLLALNPQSLDTEARFAEQTPTTKGRTRTNDGATEPITIRTATDTLTRYAIPLLQGALQDEQHERLNETPAKTSLLGLDKLHDEFLRVFFSRPTWSRLELRNLYYQLLFHSESLEMEARFTGQTPTTKGRTRTNYGATEPITIRPATNTHAIPPPPEQVTAIGELQLDLSKVLRLQQETQRVSDILNPIFNDLPQDAVQDEEQERLNEMATKTYLLGFDKLHDAFLRVLISRPTWSRVELENLGRHRGLLVEGVLDHINEAAFEKFGQPLTESDDPLLARLPELNLDFHKDQIF